MARFVLSVSFYSHLGARDNTQVTDQLKYLSPNRQLSQVRIAAQYLRERLSGTKINLGIADVTLGELRRSGEIALTLKLCSENYRENFLIFVQNFRSNK